MTELRGGAVHYASGRRPDGWAGFKVLWIVRPSYAGPIVIRGRRLDRRGPLRFSIAVEPNPDVERIVRELRRPAAAGWNEGWRDYPSTVLVRRAGCYAFRIEGASFTRTIVFRARP